MTLPRPLFLVLRTILYLLLALIFIRGAASFLPKAPLPTAAQRPEAKEAAPAEPPGLHALPALFATDYLTWDTTKPDERAERLRPYLAPGLDGQAGWKPGPTPSRQVALGAWVAGVKAVSQSRWLVTVAAKVRLEMKDQPKERILSLAIPIAKTEAGTLVVADYPSLLPAPPAPAAPAPEERGAVITDEGDRATSLLTSFFTALYAGGDVRYFLAPGATPPGAPRGFQLVSLGKPELRKQGASLMARVTLTATDEAAGTTFTFRYDLLLTEQEGRLYIQDLMQKGE
jgi:hypothetical protein